MNLSLVSFADSGNLERERVVLRATEDIDAGDYTALCSESNEPGVASSGLNTAFWFPNESVKKDDIVVLYTKRGNPSKKDIGDGHTAYFFYWGLSEPLWMSVKAAFVLLETFDFTIEWPAQTLEPEEGTRSSSNASSGEPPRP
jgi:hypothetical protein